MCVKKSFKPKTIILTTLLLLLVFCLTGCSQVNFITYHNSDGSICEYVYITLDKQELLKYNYNIASVEIEIKTNSNFHAQQLLSDYRSKLYQEYATKQLTGEQYNDYYKGVNIVEEQWKDGKYAIGLKYDNSTCYKKYYNLLNGAEFSSNGKKIEKPFYTKTYYYGTTGYGDYTIFSAIYNYYANTVFAGISPQNNTLTYSYSVDSRRMHSDADSIKVDNNGNYIHTWIVSPDEPSRQIYFYTITANKSAWIIVCTLVCLGVSIVLCIVGVFVAKRSKKINNNKIIEQTTDSNLTNDNQ